MNRQAKKNYLKQITSIVGIASISLFSSLPAFALINKTDNNSSAIGNRGNELLAQNQPGSDNSPAPRTNADDRAMPSGGGNNNTPGSREMPASESTPSRTSTPSSVPSLPPEKTTTGNKPGPAGDTSLRPGSWFCLNNPNPQCRS